MTTNQPESLESRLNRLETIFANMGEVVVAQSEAITNNTNSINRMEQAINNLTINVNRLTEQSYAFAEQTNQNINLLAQQAERDRQVFQTEIQRRWEYLLQQRGNGRQA